MLIQLKAEAIHAVQEKVKSQNDLITNNNDATDEEKEVAKNLLEASKIKQLVVLIKHKQMLK